jgi:hypothetical protein
MKESSSELDVPFWSTWRSDEGQDGFSSGTRSIGVNTVVNLFL